MHILCCPATNDKLKGQPRPHPRTLESLAMAERLGFDVSIIDVTGNDNGYWEAVRDHWDGRDLIIVEHDIAFTEEQLIGFRDCPQPWCLHPYYLRDDSVDLCDKSIGFVKFSSVVTTRVPVSHIPSNHDGSIYWDFIDGRLRCSCVHFGFRQHLHEGVVEHFHRGLISEI